MRKRLIALLVPLVLTAVSTGCGSDAGLDVRYRLEKKMWQAGLIERQIWRNPLHTDYDRIDDAIDAYEAIIAWDSLQSRGADTWSPRMRSDIRRRVLNCKIALTKLYFLRFQDNAGVTYFRSSLQRHDLMFLGHTNGGLVEAKALYRSLSHDPLELECARLMNEIRDDPALWTGDGLVGDTLLTIPLYLVRTELDKNDGDSGPGYSQLAEEFYTEVVATWPDSLVAFRSRLKKVDLYVLLERYEDALAELDTAMEASWARTRLDELRLFSAEIRAHALEQPAEAEETFRRFIESNPRRDIVNTAELDLAITRLRGAHTKEAIRMLREIPLEDDIPPETATTAMYVRAIYLKNNGNWQDASRILWRICRLYPFTRASLVAPLAIVRHYVEAGDTNQARREHKKVREFYLDAIKKDSAAIRQRHLLKDFLIESYLVVGDPAGAAETLENASVEWPGENGAVGLFKSALIYLNLVGDRENGVRMLKKCLDVFPHTRYAEVIQGQLHTVSNQPAVEQSQ